MIETLATMRKRFHEKVGATLQILADQGQTQAQAADRFGITRPYMNQLSREHGTKWHAKNIWRDSKKKTQQ